MAATAEKTDPKLWEQVKAKLTAGDKGGEAGEWSARKAQLAVREYKKAGGGYKGNKTGDNHLVQWEHEEWGTKSGKKSKDTGERYLPKQAREALSASEYKRTTAKKRADTAHGKQFSRQPADVARKAASTRHAEPSGHDEPSGPDQKETLAEFKRVVNMPPAKLRKWLDSEESRSVGMTPEGERVTHQGGEEAVGHGMGRRILELKAKKKADLSDDDLAAMRKVIGYVHRHTAQRPHGEVADTRWRKSLMNWGHDPLA